MDIASRLVELRTRRGQSLQQVADEIGISKVHIWNLETGKVRNPSIDMMRKLADHFAVTVAYLSGDDDEHSDPFALPFMREFGGKLAARDWEILRILAKRLIAD